MFVVQNPPQKPLSKLEMDQVYDLPYMRAYHPSYEAAGGVPALQEIKFSLTSARLLWWLQFLCVDISSGKDSADKKP